MELQPAHPDRLQVASEGGPRLRGGGVLAEGADQAADAHVVEGLVERDLAHVVSHQLAAELAYGAVLLAAADADVVHVHLVFDRHQVDRAQRLVEPDEGPVKLAYRLVEGPVVGRVHAGHPQQAREEVREALAQLPHQVEQRPVLADPSASEGAREVVLGLAQVVQVVRVRGLSHWTPRRVSR